SNLLPGTSYEFSLGAADDNGVLYSDIVSATTLRENNSSAQTLSNLDIGIVPVPATEKVAVSFKVQQSTSARIEIYSLNGQLVLSQPLIALEGVNIMNVNVHDLQNGTYILKVITEENNST